MLTSVLLHCRTTTQWWSLAKPKASGFKPKNQPVFIFGVFEPWGFSPVQGVWRDFQNWFVSMRCHDRELNKSATRKNTKNHDRTQSQRARGENIQNGGTITDNEHCTNYKADGCKDFRNSHDDDKNQDGGQGALHDNTEDKCINASDIQNQNDLPKKDHSTKDGVVNDFYQQCGSKSEHSFEPMHDEIHLYSSW